MKTLPLVAAVLFAVVCSTAQADSFHVSKVWWVNSALQIEVQTDSHDGADFYVGIADEKTGNNLISESIFVRVSGGRFVAEGFTQARDVTPLKAGRYWLSIAEYDFSSIVTVLPITVPKNKESVAAHKTRARVDAQETSRPEMKEADLLADPIMPGQVRMLRGLGEKVETVLVCADKEAVEERDKSMLANDEAGIEELAMARRLMIVKPGTKVKVLDLNGFLTPVAEIRILEGPHEGRRGFVLLSELAAR